jgi:putative transcriptional regulator
MPRAAHLALLLLLGLLAGIAHAQPNGLLLVAKPGLPDANFARTVVLVTRSTDAGAVGVVLNRPTERRLADLAPRLEGAGDFTEPVFAGGPVMRQVVVAVFATESMPPQAAFHVLGGVYLSMHPANVEAQLATPGARVRLYAGFSGWAPEQLERELDGGSWYVMPAKEEYLFRPDTSTLWEELVQQAGGSRT